MKYLKLKKILRNFMFQVVGSRHRRKALFKDIFFIKITWILFYFFIIENLSYFQIIIDFKNKIKLNNNKFIVIKKFYNEFKSNNFNKEILYLNLKFFFPLIENSHVYLFKGFVNDFIVSNYSTDILEDNFDKESMKLYIQFKNFFLIKTIDDEVYFFDNYVFERDINNLEVSSLAKKALKYKNFREYHKSLDKYDLGITNSFYRSLNNNNSVIFSFKDIIFSEKLDIWLIQRYNLFYIYVDNDIKKEYIFDILIFEDIIFINLYIENRLYIYKNIFNIEIIKNKDLFFIKLKEYLDNEYKFNKTYKI